MVRLEKACNTAILLVLLGGSAAVAGTHMESSAEKGAKSSKVGVVSAGRVADADVYDRQGKDIGDVEYVLVDTINNDVRYLVLEREMDGAEDALVPVPWTALTKQHRGGDVRVAVDRTKLQRARTVTEEQLNTILEPTIMSSVYNFWTPTEEKSQKKSNSVSGTFLVFRQGVASTVVAATKSYSEFEGSDVFDRNGDEIGEINDLLIRKGDGDIAFATVAHGGFLGIGDKYTPVPLAAFVYNSDLEGFQIKMTKERFVELDAFSDDSVPSRIYERDIDGLRTKFNVKK